MATALFGLAAEELGASAFLGEALSGIVGEETAGIMGEGLTEWSVKMLGSTVDKGVDYLSDKASEYMSKIFGNKRKT